MKSYINSRREFIKNIAATSMGFSAMPASILALNSWSASAGNNIENCDDYKALVCFYMFGGNDGFNTLVPRGDAEYNQYLSARSSALALPKEDLLAINPTINESGYSLGLHPNLTGVQKLFDENKLSFISNVGTLLKKNTTITDYDNGNVPLSLFSHTDQSQQWQTAIVKSRGKRGWAGLMADKFMDCNTNDKISMNISLGGNNIFQIGTLSDSFSVSSNGIIKLRGIGYNGQTGLVGSKTTAINSLFDHDYQDPLYNNFSSIMKNGIDANAELSDLLNDFNNSGQLTSPFTTENPNYTFSKDLKHVASLIGMRETLGFKRQIFFVQVPAFDTHGELLLKHGGRMTDINLGLSEFYAALEELQIDDKVVTFSMSDFGRTLSTNGDGSDHAWGSNAFVMGGPIKGGNVFGKYPSLELGNDLDVGRGSLIPTTASDLYFAELALWFGVPKSELPDLFPNIGEFYDIASNQPPMGFIL